MACCCSGGCRSKIHLRWYGYIRWWTILYIITIFVLVFLCCKVDHFSSLKIDVTLLSLGYSPFTNLEARRWHFSSFLLEIVTGAWGMDFVSSSPFFSTTPFFFKMFIIIRFSSRYSISRKTVDTEYTYYS